MSMRTVLVVDDEQAVRRLLRRILERGGLRVLTAESVAAGEQILSEGAVDAVVCDYVLPGENGLSFLERLQKSHPEVIRVLTTGHGDMRLAVNAINQAKVHYFLAKPFEPEDVLRCLAQLLPGSAQVIRRSATPPRHQQHEEMERLRVDFPGIDVVRKNTQGQILLEDTQRATHAPRAERATQEPGQAPLPRFPYPDGPEGQARAPRQPTVLRELEALHPGISAIDRSATGSIMLDEEEYEHLLDTSEYRRPTELRAKAARMPRQRESTRGARPLVEFLQPTEEDPLPRRNKRACPSDSGPFDTDLVFDEGLMELIGK